jgi:DNA mismatch repair ATPase MutS
MFYWLFIIIAIIAIIIIIAQYKKQAVRIKKLAEISEKWGQPTDDECDMRLVNLYLKASTEPGKTLPSLDEDLDLENIFGYIDRTNSKPGQQCLYKKLHYPETSLANLLERDKQVETLGKDRAAQERIEFELSRLGEKNAYYLPDLFVKEQMPLFDALLTFYIRISGLVVLTLGVLLTQVPNQFFFLTLVTLVLINTVIHYKNKGKIAQYTHSLPQLIILNKVANWLFKHVDINRDEQIKNSLNKVDQLKRSLFLVSFGNGISNDPTDIFSAVFELVKTIFLLEPLMFINSINRVNKHREHIEAVYKYVGEIDMLIAIDSVRAGLPYYTKPDLSADDMQLNIADLYHPLVEDCVPNSMFSSADKGVLITGSNMSGKTTFIRAIALNSLFAQTLFTCCAKTYQAPLLKIYTSIRVSDNIEEHKSYFQAEALAVLDIVNQCDINQPVKGLVIIDEIFRGTNTIERIAAAKSVLAYLTANRNFVFVSTHDLELAELLGDEYAIYSFEEQASDERLVFDYKIKQGLLKNKNGIAILQAMGYPQSVVADALATSEILRKKYQI